MPRKHLIEVHREFKKIEKYHILSVLGSDTPDPQHGRIHLRSYQVPLERTERRLIKEHSF